MVKNQAAFKPTSTITTYTATMNGTVFIVGRRTAPGYTLSISINGIDVIVVPAEVAGFTVITIPIQKTQTLGIKTDNTNESWLVNYKFFGAGYTY